MVGSATTGRLLTPQANLAVSHVDARSAPDQPRSQKSRRALRRWGFFTYPNCGRVNQTLRVTAVIETESRIVSVRSGNRLVAGVKLN
jgi:hypothetical protein